MTYQVGGGGQSRGSAGAFLDDFGRVNDEVILAVEKVARNVELSRAAFDDRAIKGARGEFRHSSRVVDVSLVFGDGLEDRKLIHLLETTVTWIWGILEWTL